MRRGSFQSEKSRSPKRRRGARFILGILSKTDPQKTAIQVAEVKGQPGFLVFNEDEPETVGSLDLAGGRIKGVRLVVNPEKLARLRSGAGQESL